MHRMAFLLTVWWFKIIHLDQVQKMTLNEQASRDALLVRLTHSVSASLCQLHFYLLILLQLVQMMLWGELPELNLYVNVTCSHICYRAPEMPIVKKNKQKKNTSIALLNLTPGIKMPTSPYQSIPKSLFWWDPRFYFHFYMRNVHAI